MTGKSKKYHTVTTSLTIKHADKAIEFYKKAFGAVVVDKHLGPDNKTIMHCELKIGDTIIFVNEENLEWGNKAPTSLGGSACSLSIDTENADKAFKQAIDAGAKVTMPLMDAFWGDRFGKLVDPFGHSWCVSQHLKDLTADEMKKAQDEFYAGMKKKQHSGSCSC